MIKSSMASKIRIFAFDFLSWFLLIYGFSYLAWAEQVEKGFEIAAVLTLVITLVTLALGLETLGSKLIAPPYQGGSYFKSKFWIFQLLITLVGLLAVGVTISKTSWSEFLNIDGLQGAGRIFRGILNPQMSVMSSVITKMTETLFMSLVATALAAPFAFVMSFFAARNLMRTGRLYSVYVFIRVVMNVIRSIEVLVWAIIFSVWVGIGPFAGMLALAIQSAVSLIKQFSEIIEGIEFGPVDAIKSTGANSAQQIIFGVAPQVILPFISFGVYRWDLNLRMATVVGLVGGGGIGTLLIQYMGQGQWNELGTVMLVIAVVVGLMDSFSAVVRENLR